MPRVEVRRGSWFPFYPMEADQSGVGIAGNDLSDYVDTVICNAGALISKGTL